MDADTVLPPNFLEENLKANPDLSGNGGASLLIKVSSFKKTMNCMFHKEDEDSYIGYKFFKEGFKVENHHVNHVLLRKSGGHGIVHFWYRGKMLYKNGFEPLHVLATLCWSGTVRHFVSILAYFCCFLKGEKQFDTARFVTLTQIKNLFELISLNKNR
jgi:hypothetical protein